MQRVLNQEEIDAIVQASRGLTSNRPKKEKSIQSCDFRQAGQLSRELVQAVSGMYEGFARNLSTELGLYLPVAIQALLVSVEQLTYKDFLVRTPEVTYMIPFRNGRIIIDNQDAGWHQTPHGTGLATCQCFADNCSAKGLDSWKDGAGDGDRTRDIQLGKLAFYR